MEAKEDFDRSISQLYRDASNVGGLAKKALAAEPGESQESFDELAYRAIDLFRTVAEHAFATMRYEIEIDYLRRPHTPDTEHPDSTHTS